MVAQSTLDEGGVIDFDIVSGKRIKVTKKRRHSYRWFFFSRWFAHLNELLLRFLRLIRLGFKHQFTQTVESNLVIWKSICLGKSTIYVPQ